jgi:hypothetical protein
MCARVFLHVDMCVHVCALVCVFVHVCVLVQATGFAPCKQGRASFVAVTVAVAVAVNS